MQLKNKNKNLKTSFYINKPNHYQNLQQRSKPITSCLIILQLGRFFFPFSCFINTFLYSSCDKLYLNEAIIIHRIKM